MLKHKSEKKQSFVHSVTYNKKIAVLKSRGTEEIPKHTSKTVSSFSASFSSISVVTGYPVDVGKSALLLKPTPIHA